MSKKILAACLAALSLTSCDETHPTVAPVVKPVIQSKVEQPLPQTKVVDAGLVPMAIVDAGQVDALALAHDTPAIDHLARSQQLADDGDLRGALLEARRAQFSTPDDDETLEQLGKLGQKLKQHELAAEAWGRLAALRPTDATPLIRRGHALVALRDGSGAIIAGRAAIARDDHNAEAYQITGLGQLATNDLGGAIRSFERAVELSPSHGWALNNLGYAYLRANENDKAVGVLEKAAELLPTVAFVHNNLGVALERTGQTDEAKHAYQRSMDLSPKYVKARINAARIAKAPVSDEVDDVPVDAHPIETP